MGRTKQQQTVIEAVLRDDTYLVKVEATAGAGKTFTLLEMAKELKPATGLYLAYNKAIADEAARKFKGTNIECATIHSLAWSYTVRQYGLKVGYFNVRDVQPTTLPYNARMRIVELMEEFCLSASLNPIEFMGKANVPHTIQEVFMDNMNKMTAGEISCSHSFYLKLFHVLLSSGDIVVPEVELLLIDEAGDLTELTIEVFRLLRAKKKVAVGDPMQNIYGFNNTVNAFEVLKHQGIALGLTESFRVSDLIAVRIEKFVKLHMKDDFEFTGHQYPANHQVTTEAYIARTNSGLLEEMFRLKFDGIPFHTTRKIDSILELPLILAALDDGEPITLYQYKHIEGLRKEWYLSTALQRIHKSPIVYIQQALAGDAEASRAFKVIIRHGKEELLALAEYVKSCAKVKCELMLTTAHSSKGLEFSSVTISTDMNEAVTKALGEIAKLKYSTARGDLRVVKEAMEELRLYYVACSRTMIRLVNATHLPVSKTYV